MRQVVWWPSMLTFVFTAFYLAGIFLQLWNSSSSLTPVVITCVVSGALTFWLFDEDFLRS